MKNISNQNKGAIGEYIVLSRLLLLGHDAAIANFTVNNVNGYDIFCRNNICLSIKNNSRIAFRKVCI